MPRRPSGAGGKKAPGQQVVAGVAIPSAAEMQQRLAAASAHLSTHDVAVSDADLEAELAALMGDDTIAAPADTDLLGAGPGPQPSQAPMAAVPTADLISFEAEEGMEEVEVTAADMNDPALAAELAALTGGGDDSGGGGGGGPSVQEKLRACEERLAEFKAAVGHLVSAKDTARAKQFFAMSKPIQALIDTLKAGRDTDISALPEVPSLTAAAQRTAAPPQAAPRPAVTERKQQSAAPPPAHARAPPAQVGQQPDFDLIARLTAEAAASANMDDLDDDDFDDEDLMLDDELDLLAELEGLGPGTDPAPPKPEPVAAPAQPQQAAAPVRQAAPQPAPAPTPAAAAPPQPQEPYRRVNHGRRTPLKQQPQQQPEARGSSKRKQEADHDAQLPKAAKNVAYVQRLEIEYKIAARDHHRKGDIDMASYCLKVAQQLAAVAKQLESGQEYDLRNLPPPPTGQLTANPRQSAERAKVFDVITKALKQQMQECDDLSASYARLGNLAAQQKFAKTKLKFKQDTSLVLGAKVNGEEPPSFTYREYKFPFQRSFPHLLPTEGQIEVIRILDMVPPKGVTPENLRITISSEVGYPDEDEPQTEESKSFGGACSLVLKDCLFKFKIQRSRSFQRFCKREKLLLHVQHHTPGVFGLFGSKDRTIGCVAIPLTDFQTKCEIHGCFDMVKKDRLRRPIGGKIEVRVRLRQPLEGKDVTQKPVRWLILQTNQSDAISRMQQGQVTANVEAVAAKVRHVAEQHTARHPQPAARPKRPAVAAATAKAPPLPSLDGIVSYEVVKEEYRLAAQQLQPVMHLITGGKPLPVPLQPVCKRWMEAKKRMTKMEAALTSLEAMKEYFQRVSADLPARKAAVMQLQSHGYREQADRAAAMYRIQLAEAKDLQKNLAQMGA